ncbi:MAG: MCP four helix bundle domain-containing protein [Geobacteraceae bacterium]|nr:MCP four helix bundle domain-containing protein [Geobacteraceae bacterium]
MLKNLKIGKRLGIGFAVMLALILLVGITGYWGVNESTSTTIHMLKGDASISENASRLRANVVGMRRYEKDIFLNITDKAKVLEYYTKWQEQHEHTGLRVTDLEKIVVLEKEKASVASIKSEEDKYEKGFNKVYALILNGKIKTPAEANEAMSEVKKEIHTLEATAKELADVSNKRMDAQEKTMADLARHVAMIVICGIIIAIILCIVISVLITRSITTPINTAVMTANRLAEGDLVAEVVVTSNDEVGQLLGAMKHMAESLRKMIAGIRDTSSQVATAAGQISANSVQLTKSAHSQASASEETSATMVQMAASIQTVASNTDSLASNADEVSSSIQELGASSEQVAKSAETMASSVSETSATIEQMTVSIEKVAKSTEDLASSVSETSSTIEQMTVSIDQVAGNSQELQRVVIESASIIEQMAASIKQVAKSVEEADAVAKSASKDGSAGLQAGQQAVAAMNRVSEVIDKTSASIVNLGRRSEEIGGIVKVINEIADQTNLLALNAAIEAARAGDAGRGFAVVAEEVRKLAERSMVATKEIAQVIKQVQADTTESVKYGEIASNEAKTSMELTTLTGNSLENIVASIAKTSLLMSDISRMTAEQSNSSNKVTTAVEKMNQATDVVTNASREQAQGGRQIRIAVERMNHITQEVTVATKEQAAGSKQIRIAVENMNHVTGQVSIATKEQSLSARQIVSAVNSMATMTQSVANATQEQKKGGEMVVGAMENISDLTRENLSSVEQLSRAAESLSQQAEDLAGMVAAFRV